MQSGNIANFKELSNFSDLKDFNNHFEQWMTDIKKKFTKAELVALKRLIRFSAKVAGVCNAKIGTLVAATHEKDGAGISRSTFKRMVTKAKDLGLLTVHETERKNGSQSSNVYVFSRYEVSLQTTSEPPKQAILDYRKNYHSSETTKQNIKELRTDELDQQKESSTLDASFTSEAVPAAFTNFVKCFYDDAKTIEEFWRCVVISAYKHSITECVIDTSIRAYKVLVRKIKNGNIINQYGFYTGILNKKFKAIGLKNMLDLWWEKV